MNARGINAHILIVADGRSPTARSWIRNVQSLGYTVSLISTYPCDPPDGLKHFHILPIAFSRFSAGSAPANPAPQKSRRLSLLRRFSSAFQFIRYRLGPLSLLSHVKAYRELVKDIQPDLVHGLRIPFEGMLASYTPKGIPCLVATWGNDLTLHARGSWLMRLFTRRCLKRANGLTSDTRRDVRLAQSQGLEPAAPTLVVPGSGGLALEELESTSPFDANRYGFSKRGIWLVNPRGTRPGSVHQDVFFAALPQVIAQYPSCQVMCPSLAGNKQAQEWIDNFQIGENTHLLPRLSQPELWSLFKQTEIFVSPSSHDGTPNTLLEAMACGCFPVAGEIESLQEWIEDGVNGLLVDPRDPDLLAKAILKAVADQTLRQEAAALNKQIVASRASLSATLPEIQSFYDQFLA
jgi:glycosyltransferase involved in cell wall biosynthesis